ncbi:UDP-glycosyltransferase 74B1-like [Euphorbia lathyris]|uniref:UDP-glycosyltransferase 74B1-like n=1 Tax=Euphorbia lathyris TaxID=212925 RepID=UPI003313D895
MKETEYKAHVLVVPYPSQGHINPLLQFAKRLLSKGVKATLATTHYTVKSIYVPNVAVEPISDGFDETGFAQAKDVALYLNSFKVNGSATLSRLVRAFEESGFRVNCIVYDSFLPWALDVAKEHGVYGAPFFTNSAAVCSIFCRLHHGLLRCPVELGDQALCLPGLPPLYGSDLPTFLRVPDSYPAYLAMKLNQFRNLEMADWVFANTFQDLESKETGGVHELWPAKFIGPMIPSAYLGLGDPIEGDKGYGASLWKPLGEECVKWLETKQPQSVVYISFGSMVSLTVKQMEQIAWGLKETNLNFFWVVRESEMCKLPTGFIDSTKDKGMIVTWCNQLELLAHQALGCFVTHCGWNSTLEALSLGVPMVCVPQWTDQLPNAKYIEDVWMVGVRAKEDEKGLVVKEEIVRCLKEVMEGKKSQQIKKNAKIWKQKARETVAEGGESDNQINDFVEGLQCANKIRTTPK